MLGIIGSNVSPQRRSGRSWNHKTISRCNTSPIMPFNSFVCRYWRLPRNNFLRERIDFADRKGKMFSVVHCTRIPLCGIFPNYFSCSFANSREGKLRTLLHFYILKFHFLKLSSHPSLLSRREECSRFGWKQNKRVLHNAMFLKNFSNFPSNGLSWFLNTYWFLYNLDPRTPSPPSLVISPLPGPGNIPVLRWAFIHLCPTNSPHHHLSSFLI